MVFYRTYRPQKISQLDSTLVREGLSSILSSKEIPHAFLLTGPKGLGKTSTARIVAKIVNCERKKGIEPCNRCVSCTSITNGTNLDVLEIDAASNRGIDEIRDLREKIKLAPSAAFRKVYIVDEVHMLTTEAFNALLKTLEEPPSHAMFILCTTDLHKVPGTIQSRCFPVVFRKASEDELIHSLKRIITNERIAIKHGALSAIAKASDGSFRDASKLLEQAVAIAGKKKISQEIIQALLGKTSRGENLIALVVKKDVKGALDWVSRAADEGLNMRSWLEDTLEVFHTALLSKYEVKNGEVDTIVCDLSEEELKQLIRLFTRAHQELRYAVIPQLPLELAIIEYCVGKGGDTV